VDILKMALRRVAMPCGARIGNAGRCSAKQGKETALQGGARLGNA
jgi:hypothetical protein